MAKSLEPKKIFHEVMLPGVGVGSFRLELSEGEPENEKIRAYLDQCGKIVADHTRHNLNMTADGIFTMEKLDYERLEPSNP